jgi:hypothetical protein
MPSRVHSGTFRVGHPRYGGRQKGVPNKIKMTSVKQILDSYNLEPVRMMLSLLPKLNPWQQSQIFVTLMPYYYPKPQFEIYNYQQTLVTSNPYMKLPREELLQVLQQNTNGNDTAAGN